MRHNELEIDKEFRAGRHASIRRPPRLYIERLKKLDEKLELFYNPYGKNWEIWREHSHKKYPYAQILEFPPYIELEEYFEFALMRLRRMKKRLAPTIREIKAEHKYRIESRKRKEKEMLKEIVEDTYDWLTWGKKYFPMR